MQRAPVDDRVRLFGIRHHGPGSARSLVAALDEWQPQVLLVEGPAESAEIVPFLLDESLTAPVAMLFYAVDTPRWAAYYPLADFSPELQAFRWAGRAERPVRFMDLPAGAMLGMSTGKGGRSDVLDEVAEAAGFEDTQEWWDHLVERRVDPVDLFLGIEALITAVREDNPSGAEDDGSPEPEEGRRPVSSAEYENLREAHMRSILREALAEGHERIAVVCGAWHVPALRAMPSAKVDNALLRGLPKVKVRGTVIPWTFDRMTFESGYGAGVRSPAYYDLVFQTAEDNVSRAWLLRVARLMRSEDLDASPAGVIEAVRLADALAALRGRPRPGLRELGEAAGSVLIRDPAVWGLIRRRLIVGERMGAVPDGVPMIPLQTDLTAQQKRLRLPVDGTDRRLELDLRGEIDLQRSHLLYRLSLLGIGWGQPERVTGKKGTFHELWRLQWRPELTISLIEASVYGGTVRQAASSCAIRRADAAETLAAIAGLVSQVLTADLPDAIDAVITKLRSIAATHSDVGDLADALPPLAAIVRYGTVRRTDAEQVLPVLDAIFARLCVGLPGACVGLDDDSAGAMTQRLDSIHATVGLFAEAEKGAQWVEALGKVAALHGVHPLVAGKAERLRFDLGAVDGDYLGLRLGQAASAGTPAKEAAAFVEGMLSGPGAILLHQDVLFRAVDDWLVDLGRDVFEEILPLVRRTFSLFSRPERRQIGERVAGRAPAVIRSTDFNEERARRVLPTVRLILGMPNE